LLDEWLAGLNRPNEPSAFDLVQTICQSGVTMILVEHAMLAVRTLCDLVIVMDAGSKVAKGKPDAVLANPEVVRASVGDDDA
jgi:branched-chain amino acid transport system ATP-binding protein